MAINGGVQITGFLSPTASGDTYATHDALYGRDGLRNVDLLSDLDNIDDDRRRAGMIVGVGGYSGFASHYTLQPEGTGWTHTIADWSLAFLTPTATTASDTYVTGLTLNMGNYELTAHRNDAVDITQSLAILASDMVVTGGTYSIGTGVVTFTNNSGGTFNVSGFTSGMTDTYTSGVTLNGTVLDFDRNDSLSAFTVDLNTLTLSGDPYEYGSGLSSIQPKLETNNAATKYSVIGGGRFNSMSGGSWGYHVIAGGGYVAGKGNTIFDSNWCSILGGYYHKIQNGAGYATIGGGRQHTIDNTADCFIGGGFYNQINTSTSSVIGGGATNYIMNSSQFGFIGCGLSNEIGRGLRTQIAQPDPAASIYNVIGGGLKNSIISGQTTACFIGGGNGNQMSTTRRTVIGGGDRNYIYNANNSFIGGGILNTMTGNTSLPLFHGSGTNVIGGGDSNIIHDNYDVVIGGGNSNKVATTIEAAGIFTPLAENTSSRYSNIGGGLDNDILGSQAASIGGGHRNRIISAKLSFIGGGANNLIDSGSTHSSIVGGIGNWVTHDSSHILGSNISSISANTTHVERLNVGTLNGTVALTSLALDSNGMVVDGSSLIGGFATGETSPFQYNTGTTTAIEPILGSNGDGTSGIYSFIGGGQYNLAEYRNTATVGGYRNTAGGGYSSAILGGQYNSTSSFYSAIAGGLQNKANGNRTFIGGGSANSATTADSTVIGGNINRVSGIYSSIVGGKNNLNTGLNSSIIGGSASTVTHNHSQVLGSNITSVSAHTTHVENLIVSGNIWTGGVQVGATVDSGGVTYNVTIDDYYLRSTTTTGDTSYDIPSTHASHNDPKDGQILVINKQGTGTGNIVVDTDITGGLSPCNDDGTYDRLTVSGTNTRVTILYDADLNKWVTLSECGGTGTTTYEATI